MITTVINMVGSDISPLSKVGEYALARWTTNSAYDVKQLIFIVNKNQFDNPQIDKLLHKMFIRPHVLVSDTPDILKSLLLTQELINNGPMLIMNHDRIINYSKDNLGVCIRYAKPDAIVLSNKNKNCHSIDISNDLKVSNIAINRQVSDLSPVGMYYCRFGTHFIQYIKQMIAKNVKVDYNTYLPLIFNEFAHNGKLVLPFNTNSVYNLNTKTEIDEFVDKYARK